MRDRFTTTNLSYRFTIFETSATCFATAVGSVSTLSTSVRTIQSFSRPLREIPSDSFKEGRNIQRRPAHAKPDFN